MPRADVQSVYNEVFEGLPTFIENVLRGGWDVVVPIGSEALSVLGQTMDTWPRDGSPQIIPDRLLRSMSPDRLRGKHVLVLDASLFSGWTMKNAVTTLSEAFGANVTTAGFFVHQDCTEQPQVMGFNRRLSTDEYIWAKEALLVRRLQDLYPLDCDHIAFAFEIDGIGGPSALIEAVTRSMYSYRVGDPRAPVQRLTVDNIEWDPTTMGLDPALRNRTVCKVRLFVPSRTEDPASAVRFSAMPVIFPPTPRSVEEESIHGCPVGEKDCPICAPGSAGKQSSEMTQDDRTFDYYLRCALHANIRLLAAFVQELQDSLPRSASIRLVPNPRALTSYQFFSRNAPQELFEYSRAQILPPRNVKGRATQLHLQPQMFRFHKGTHFLDQSLACPPQDAQVLKSNYSAEYQLGRHVALWYQQKDRESGGGRHTDWGLDFEQLCTQLAGHIRPSMISRSLDACLDEGTIRPRNAAEQLDLSSGSSEYWVRVYRRGGEFFYRTFIATAFIELGRTPELQTLFR